MFVSFFTVKPSLFMKACIYALLGFIDDFKRGRISRHFRRIEIKIFRSVNILLWDMSLFSF